jgi:hypothetical protein
VVDSGSAIRPQRHVFVGLALVTSSLLMLWLASWRKSKHSNSLFDVALKDDGIEPVSVDCRGQLFPDDRPPATVIDGYSPH